MVHCGEEAEEMGNRLPTGVAVHDPTSLPSVPFFLSRYTACNTTFVHESMTVGAMFTGGPPSVERAGAAAGRRRQAVGRSAS